MSMRSFPVLVCVLSLAGAVVAIGCGDDEDADGTTAGPGATSGPTGTGGGTGAAGGEGTGGTGGMGTGGMGTGGMGTGGMGTGGTGTGGAGGGSSATINGCDEATATDMTGMNEVTISFPGNNFSYSPKCVKISQGTKLIFSAEGLASFMTHPLVGGVVENNMKKEDPQSPITKTTMGTQAEFRMSEQGGFGFYCDLHALAGMTGAAFVVP